MGVRRSDHGHSSYSPENRQEEDKEVQAASIRSPCVSTKAGGGQRVLTLVCVVSSRERSLCPTSGMVPTRRPATCCQGFKKFVIYNEKDLELLLMYNRTYAAEVAHSVSRKTRAAILERAKVLDVKVTNAAARLETEENE